MRGKYLASLGLAIALAISGVLSKGKLPSLALYFQGREAYPGFSVLTRTELVTDGAKLRSIAEDLSYDDYRRAYPAFDGQLRSPTTAEGLERYRALVEAVRKAKAGADGERQAIAAVVEVIGQAYLSNQHKPEANDQGLANFLAADYVYQLANAKIECGTVGEATVALFRDLGYRARLVITSNRLDNIAANHILAEVYSVAAGRWLMLDPMVNYVGETSVFNIVGTPEGSAIAQRHRNSVMYGKNALLWLDRRGPIRTKYYYTPSTEIGDLAARL